jgi:hypothetical protein
MKIYLAGAMRGIPEFNYPAFHDATVKLRNLGHFVFSPAERDIQVTGVDISKGNLTGDNAIAEAEHGFNLGEALRDDLVFICMEAEAIVLLPGWEKSRGVAAELATAVALDRKVMTLAEAISV